MINDLVSVIMPVYNSKRFLEKSILSVMDQSYENWELILIDDCSVDGSKDIIKEYATKDDRIRAIEHTENKGVAAARNTGIENAKGQYIAFLDSDDLWKKDKLKKQISFMKSKEVAFCYTGCEIIDEAGEFTGKIRQVPLEADYKYLLGNNAIPCLTVVLDREKVKNIKMEKIRHEDYALWLDILKSGIKARGINENLASYRVCKTSLSGNKLKAAGWTFKILREHEQLGYFKSCCYMVKYMYCALAKRI